MAMQCADIQPELCEFILHTTWYFATCQGAINHVPVFIGGMRQDGDMMTLRQLCRHMTNHQCWRRMFSAKFPDFGRDGLMESQLESAMQLAHESGHAYKVIITGPRVARTNGHGILKWVVPGPPPIDPDWLYISKNQPDTVYIWTSARAYRDYDPNICTSGRELCLSSGQPGLWLRDYRHSTSRALVRPWVEGASQSRPV